MAIEALASLDDLEVRLEFELEDEHMRAMAEGALIDASVLVCEYGDSKWTTETAPPIAVMLTLKAAARFMNNPSLQETARGGDETSMWGDYNAKGVHLEPSEIELLREHRRESRGFQSAPTYVHTARPVQPALFGHYFVVEGYGSGTAKLWPDYRPGDEYRPLYPRDFQPGGYA